MADPVDVRKQIIDTRTQLADARKSYNLRPKYSKTSLRDSGLQGRDQRRKANTARKKARKLGLAELSIQSKSFEEDIAKTAAKYADPIVLGRLAGDAKTAITTKIKELQEKIASTKERASSYGRSKNYEKEGQYNDDANEYRAEMKVYQTALKKDSVDLVPEYFSNYTSDSAKYARDVTDANNKVNATNKKAAAAYKVELAAYNKAVAAIETAKQVPQHTPQYTREEQRMIDGMNFLKDNPQAFGGEGSAMYNEYAKFNIDEMYMPIAQARASYKARTAKSKPDVYGPKQVPNYVAPKKKSWYSKLDSKVGGVLPGGAPVDPTLKKYAEKKVLMPYLPWIPFVKTAAQVSKSSWYKNIDKKVGGVLPGGAPVSSRVKKNVAAPYKKFDSKIRGVLPGGAPLQLKKPTLKLSESAPKRASSITGAAVYNIDSPAFPSREDGYVAGPGDITDVSGSPVVTPGNQTQIDLNTGTAIDIPSGNTVNATTPEMQAYLDTGKVWNLQDFQDWKDAGGVYSSTEDVEQVLQEAVAATPETKKWVIGDWYEDDFDVNNVTSTMKGFKELVDVDVGGDMAWDMTATTRARRKIDLILSKQGSLGPEDISSVSVEDWKTASGELTAKEYREAVYPELSGRNVSSPGNDIVSVGPDYTKPAEALRKKIGQNPGEFDLTFQGKEGYFTQAGHSITSSLGQIFLGQGVKKEMTLKDMNTIVQGKSKYNPFGWLGPKTITRTVQAEAKLRELKERDRELLLHAVNLESDRKKGLITEKQYGERLSRISRLSESVQNAIGRDTRQRDAEGSLIPGGTGIDYTPKNIVAYFQSTAKDAGASKIRRSAVGVSSGILNTAPYLAPAGSVIMGADLAVKQGSLAMKDTRTSSERKKAAALTALGVAVSVGGATGVAKSFGTAAETGARATVGPFGKITNSILSRVNPATAYKLTQAGSITMTGVSAGFGGLRGYSVYKKSGDLTSAISEGIGSALPLLTVAAAQHSPIKIREVRLAQAGPKHFTAYDRLLRKVGVPIDTKHETVIQLLGIERNPYISVKGVVMPARGKVLAYGGSGFHSKSAGTGTTVKVGFGTPDIRRELLSLDLAKEGAVPLGSTLAQSVLVKNLQQLQASGTPVTRLGLVPLIGKYATVSQHTIGQKALLAGDKKAVAARQSTNELRVYEATKNLPRPGVRAAVKVVRQHNANIFGGKSRHIYEDRILSDFGKVTATKGAQPQDIFTAKTFNKITGKVRPTQMLNRQSYVSPEFKHSFSKSFYSQSNTPVARPYSSQNDGSGYDVSGIFSGKTAAKITGRHAQGQWHWTKVTSDIDARLDYASPAQMKSATRDTIKEFKRVSTVNEGPTTYDLSKAREVRNAFPAGHSKYVRPTKDIMGNYKPVKYSQLDPAHTYQVEYPVTKFAAPRAGQVRLYHVTKASGAKNVMQKGLTSASRSHSQGIISSKLTKDNVFLTKDLDVARAYSAKLGNSQILGVDVTNKQYSMMGKLTSKGGNYVYTKSVHAGKIYPAGRTEYVKAIEWKGPDMDEVADPFVMGVEKAGAPVKALPSYKNDVRLLSSSKSTGTFVKVDRGKALYTTGLPEESRNLAGSLGTVRRIIDPATGKPILTIMPEPDRLKDIGAFATVTRSVAKRTAEEHARVTAEIARLKSADSSSYISTLGRNFNRPAGTSMYFRPGSTSKEIAKLQKYAIDLSRGKQIGELGKQIESYYPTALVRENVRPMMLTDFKISSPGLHLNVAGFGGAGASFGGGGGYSSPSITASPPSISPSPTALWSTISPVVSRSPRGVTSSPPPKPSPSKPQPASFAFGINNPISFPGMRPRSPSKLSRINKKPTSEISTKSPSKTPSKSPSISTSKYVTSPGSPGRARTVRIVPFPKVAFISRNKEKRKEKRQDSQQGSGYEVLVRKKGKYISLAPFATSREEAIAIGAEKVLSTSAATFKVVRSTKAFRKTGKKASSKLGTFFRPSKSNEAGVYIQKQETRLSSYGERSEIIPLGIQARKKQGKKKKKKKKVSKKKKKVSIKKKGGKK